MSRKKRPDSSHGSSKQIFPIIVLIFVGIIVGIVALYTLKSAFISEDALNTYTGEITFKGVITETGPLVKDPETGIRSRSSQDFFHLRLKGLGPTLESYNMDERYWKLDNALKVGDVITVQYEPYDDPDLDLTLYKIEKSGVIILESSGLRLRYKIVGFIAALGAVLIFLKVYFLLKTKKQS